MPARPSEQSETVARRGQGSDAPARDGRAWPKIVMAAQQKDRRAGVLGRELKSPARGQIRGARADDGGGADAQRLFHRPGGIAGLCATHDQNAAGIEAEGFEASRIRFAEGSAPVGRERPHHDTAACAERARRQRQEKSRGARDGAKVGGCDLVQRPQGKTAARKAGVDGADPGSDNAKGVPIGDASELAAQRVERGLPTIHGRAWRDHHRHMFPFCSSTAPRSLTSQRRSREEMKNCHNYLLKHEKIT